MPAPIRFVSYEPALGPVDFSRWLDASRGTDSRAHCWLQWIIAGGESGPGARPCALEWLQDVREQCAEAGVPFFCKQLGSVVVSEQRAADDAAEFEEWKRHGLKSATAKWPDDRWGWRMGTRDRKGGDMAEFPEDLRVRQLPAPG